MIMVKMILLMFNVALSTLFVFIIHPLILGCTLMIQTLITCLMISFIQTSNWIAFMAFLLIAGNMMILFLYVVSLASNENIYMTFNSSLNKLMMMMIPSALILSNSWITKQPNEILSNTLVSQSLFHESAHLIKLTYTNTSSVSVLLMLILFFSLCTTITIISIYEGPMRQMN